MIACVVKCRIIYWASVFGFTNYKRLVPSVCVSIFNYGCLIFYTAFNSRLFTSSYSSCCVSGGVSTIMGAAAHIGHSG